MTDENGNALGNVVNLAQVKTSKAKTTKAKATGSGKVKACPICAKEAVAKYHPFCSKRCADIDLGRWLNEDYRLPAEEPPEGADQGLPDDPEGLKY